MTWSIQSVIENRHLDLGWKITALVAGVVIFGRPAFAKLRQLMRRHARAEAADRRRPAVPAPAVLNRRTCSAGTTSGLRSIVTPPTPPSGGWWRSSANARCSPSPQHPLPFRDDRVGSRQNAEGRRIERLRLAAVRALHAPAPGACRRSDRRWSHRRGRRPGAMPRAIDRAPAPGGSTRPRPATPRGNGSRTAPGPHQAAADQAPRRAADERRHERRDGLDPPTTDPYGHSIHPDFGGARLT